METIKEYNGFLKSKYVRLSSKAREDLSKETTYSCLEINGNDEEITSANSDYVHMLVENGFVPSDTKSEKGKITYIMEKGEIKFKVLRTLADYARYLIENQFLKQNTEEDDNIEADTGITGETAAENNEKDDLKTSAENTAAQDNVNNNGDLSESVTNGDSDGKKDSDIIENKKANAEKISNKNDFEVKLMQEAAQYPDNEKTALLKKVFETETGTYDEHSKELLVLIEHFDDKDYKNALAGRLWSGNTVSRKVFECITGLKLPTTNIEIGKYFAALTKADFKKMAEYKPVTAAEQIEEKTFYIKSSNGFEKVQGYEYLVDGLELFIRYTQTEVVISDSETGVMLSKGTNESDAKENLRKIIDKIGIDNLKKKLSGQEKTPGFKEKEKIKI